MIVTGQTGAAAILVLLYLSMDVSWFCFFSDRRSFFSSTHEEYGMTRAQGQPPVPSLRPESKP